MRLGAIHLRNKDIKKELIDRAQFIFWAAGGAMGDGGAFEIVTDDGRAYYCNCVYGDADPDLILEACPLIRDDAQDSGLWEGWVFHYLGGGNFLLFRKEYEEKYNELLGDEFEYGKWHDIALTLCRKPGVDYDDDDIITDEDEEGPGSDTVFVAWADEGVPGNGGLAGELDDDSEDGVMFLSFGEGVGIESFYPVSSLMDTEGWLHQDLGNGRHIIVNTKYADKFLKISKRRELLKWLATSKN
ncbi:MAG: hypothetical protein IJG65_00890 [Synergistaceae bacterium]|nr:hypothetical protein [Synergistaceae bacterium]